MAKLPKKKIPKRAATKTPAKAKAVARPKVVAKGKPAAKAKPAAKPAKPAVKVKPVTKGAAKKPKAKVTPKPKTTKPKPGAKPAPKKSLKSPMKPVSVMALMDDEGAIGGEGAAPAAPHIDSPTDGASVPANTALPVTVSTNRSDLGYTIELTDITPPGPPPAPVTFPVAAPAGNPFTMTIPAVNLAAGKTYKIKVIPDPPSAGATHEITVTT